MRSSFAARSIRFSMSRIDSRYSLSFSLSPRLIFGLQALRVLPDLVEDAPVDLTAAAVPDQTIEHARGIQLLGRGLGRRDPRHARAVDHRQAVLEAQLVRLDAEHQARNRGAAADSGGDDLIHRRADPDLVRIEADRGARQHVHAARGAGWSKRRAVWL